MNIFCWFRGIWWSLCSFLKSGNGIPWSGHVYQDEETHKNVTLTLGRCEDCGSKDFSWTK